MARTGVPRVVQRRITRRRHRVAELRAQGVSLVRIGELLHCGTTTVTRDVAALELRGRKGTAPTPPALSAPPPPRRPVVPSVLAPRRSGRVDPAVALAGRLGALAQAYTQGVRAELEGQLIDLRRRHNQEVAALKAQSERQRKDLQSRLAVMIDRAQELQERATTAERRAGLLAGRVASLERHVPIAELIQTPPPV